MRHGVTAASMGYCLLLGSWLCTSIVQADGGASPSPQADVPEQAPEKSSLIVTQEYIIGPEDVLEITVWKNTDLSKIVQVRPDGKISMPLIGDVSAVGRTAGQLTQEIANRLKSYMETPTLAEVRWTRKLPFGKPNGNGAYFVGLKFMF